MSADNSADESVAPTDELPAYVPADGALLADAADSLATDHPARTVRLALALAAELNNPRQMLADVEHVDPDPGEVSPPWE
jgi:hypothetical protein